MARLPQPGSDNGTWGTILNEYLSQTLNTDGSIKDNVVTNATIAPNAVTATEILNGSITEAQLASAVQTKLDAASGTPDWSVITDKPAVIAAGADQASARTAIGAGTSDLVLGTTNTTAKAGDYVPTKSDVGLSSVDNTSDATKNSATATLTNKNLTSGTNTFPTFNQSTTGNAATATKLATARNINGVAFDGTNDISIKSAPDADYYISINGSNYVATKSDGTSTTNTNASTLIQACIDALTTGATGAGSVGAGGGVIEFGEGSFTMSNELLVTGWEGISGVNSYPHSQLIFQGQGLATKLLQSNSGQNIFHVKNNASIIWRNMYLYTNGSAMSCIYGGSDGANSETSIWGGEIENVTCESNSTGSPAVYLKNFFDLSVPWLKALNSANHGIVLENNSTNTNYGNSHFGMLNAGGSTATGFAGLVIRSTDPYKKMNLIKFDSIFVNSSYYGVYSKGASNVDLGFLDLEACQECVFLDAGSSGGQYQSFHFTNSPSSYLLPNSNGKGWHLEVNSGGNRLKGYVETNTNAVPIYDNSQWVMSNEWDIKLYLDTDLAACYFNQPTRQKIRIESSQGTFYDNQDGLNSKSSKTTPVDADELPLSDSANNWYRNRLTFGNLKSTVATYITTASQTYSNKRMTPRVATVTQSATPTINSDMADVVSITGLAQAITSMTTNLTGTPNAGDTLNIEITDSGTARAITWGAKFEGELPLITRVNEKMTAVFRWNVATSKWRLQSVSGVGLYYSTHARVSMNGSPAQTLATGSTWQKLSFTTKNQDFGNNFNTSTYVYTTPSEGIYSLSAMVRFSDSTTYDTGTGVCISNSASGSNFVPLKTSSNASRVSINWSEDVYYGAGQTLATYVFCDSVALPITYAEMSVTKIA